MRRRIRLFIFVSLAVAYAVTWLLGVPAVVSDVATKRLRDAAWVIRHEEPGDPQYEGYPWLRVNLVVPVAPGVVFISHGGEVRALGGYGQWALYAWYGSGVRLLIEEETWVS